jgi:hypothetical protein
MSKNNGITANEILLKIVRCTYFNACEEANDALNSLDVLNSSEQKLLVKELLYLLERNKLSATLLGNYQYSFSYEGARKLIEEALEKDLQYTRNYFTVLKQVVKTLNKVDVNYVLIKHYLMKHVKMLDIDLHIYDPDEILRACEALSKLDAIFYDFRFFSHPLKLGIKVLSIDPLGEVSVEIYPEIAVGRIIVGCSREFMDKATKVAIADATNEAFDARMLPVTENLYTMLTHDWYSQHIPLSTVVYLLANIHRCDVNRLQQLGEKHGTVASVYTFLKLASALDKALQIGVVSEDIRRISEVSNFHGKASIDRWVKEVESRLKFPLEIPYKFIFSSMPYHITKIVKKVGVIKTLYDVYSHFIPLLTYLYEFGKRFTHA